MKKKKWYRNRSDTHTRIHRSAITERCTTARPPARPAGCPSYKLDVLGLKFLSWKCSQAFHSDSLFHIETVRVTVHTCFNAWSALYLPRHGLSHKRKTPHTKDINNFNTVHVDISKETRKKKLQNRALVIYWDFARVLYRPHSFVLPWQYWIIRIVFVII